MAIKKLDEFFENISSKTAIVIGDIMLDTYLFGDSSRKSPEAPVNIVNVEKKENKIGGAGNVACNLKSLGFKTFLFGFIGNDENGKTINSILKKYKIPISGLIKTSCKTTNKVRIINTETKKQLLRIDQEEINYKQSDEKNTLFELIKNKIHLADFIIIQDYNKGLLDKDLIKNILLLASKHNVSVMVDPKELNLLEYKNVKLFKPNLLEAEKLLSKKIILENKFLKKDLEKIKQKINCEYVLITLGKDGLCIYGDNLFYREKGINNEIVDVTGAGDSVICLAALGFCAKLEIPEIAKLANYSGYISCQNSGTYSIKHEDIKKL